MATLTKKRKRFRVNAEATSDNYEQHLAYRKSVGPVMATTHPHIRVFGKLKRVSPAQVANLKQQFEIVYR